ncbi:hypothetical protein QQ054_09370 [Oscillatoria amoena NRMC-F 0135]|nr:hypothetical protein [Oscillatoria laete-virens]MDL5046243.1 hypothetical protein [Oscillatoria amoena NRMC-F 0135]MDL5053931.1 hypothetical protein [Oscillatoria laete-virens NRMC-F 0139]
MTVSKEKRLAELESVGLGHSPDEETRKKRLEYINLKLAANGLATAPGISASPILSLGKSIIRSAAEKNRRLGEYLCPVDQRIQNFLDAYLADLTVRKPARLPGDALTLDFHGIARELSLPHDRDQYSSDIVNSYRVWQGVLHNPKSDRRTTEGVFHVAEGGLAIPADKKAVPKAVFADLLHHALHPPGELARLPFLSGCEGGRTGGFVSLLLRPLVSPEVPGISPELRMEVRFFAPGNLVGNLDFVESIFGNAGDPHLPENDAALDPGHWSGHTGCVILAPQLIRLTKKQLGLPHVNDATARQRRDGMCWERDDELYNDGQAFKITARDRRGVIVTLIADNYFGYCKKEVKTQISYACNLRGLSEEEHAGGAIARASYDLGDQFDGAEMSAKGCHTFGEQFARLGGSMMAMHPDGYAVDQNYSDIIYLPENARFNLRDNTIQWEAFGTMRRINLLSGVSYLLPGGYLVELLKPSEMRQWRLVGTYPEGTFCHKPCTVSGGGKSEISKSIADAILKGPVFVADFERDFEAIRQVLFRDYSDRFRTPPEKPDTRELLSPLRTLGSVIKLLTPSPDYTDAYNSWLRSIPLHVRDLILVVKRRYRPEWGEHWPEFFSVDTVDGMPGYELKFNNQKLVTQYLRIGFTPSGQWRTFTLRKDFIPSMKVQTEDDISVSMVVPASQPGKLDARYRNPSVKFVINCEYRFFQRPDDAIHRGYDKKAEEDFSTRNGFFSNYEALTRTEAIRMTEVPTEFDRFTDPLKKCIGQFAAASQPEYMVSTDSPRIVDGKRTKNPRYLQVRPDLENPRSVYLSEMMTRLQRKLGPDEPVCQPVNAVLPGRRNNPQGEGIRALAVFNPIHYQELPELFMDFISSLTGKSPSTTGAGSEGALTKGPFNAILPVHDLNGALVSFIMTGYHGFSTAAGYVGPKFPVAHDISLLVPEIWARMFPHEREPEHLIRTGALEKLQDFEYKGRMVLASRLGWRITARFAREYLGRIFSNPEKVFTPEMLRPENQGIESFVDGVDNIVETMKQVAARYFEDGSVEAACPPLKALLHIMAEGHFEGRDISDPAVRGLFDRDTVLQSPWYRDRLLAARDNEKHRLEKCLDALKNALAQGHLYHEEFQAGIRERIRQAERSLERVGQADYVEALVGTIGAEPHFPMSE